MAGHRVTYAGDVDGDGADDLLVGAPCRGSTPSKDFCTGVGAVYIVRGGLSPPSSDLGDAAVVVDGVADYHGIGWRIAPAGDHDGDGLGDVLIGGFNGVYVFLAPRNESMPVTAADVKFVAEGSGLLGEDFSPAGDVNGDGYTDILIGDRRDGTVAAYAGSSYVVLGSAGD